MHHILMAGLLGYFSILLLLINNNEMNIYMQTFLFLPGILMILNSCLVVCGFINEIIDYW